MSVSVPVFIIDPMSGDGDVVEDDDSGMGIDVLVDAVVHEVVDEVVDVVVDEAGAGAEAEAEAEAEVEAVWEIEGGK